MARTPKQDAAPPPINRPWAYSDRPIPRVIVQPVQSFLQTEVASGLVLLTAAVVALLWANSPAGASYEALWATDVRFSVGSFVLAEDLRHWVNDLLMALFFFVVGLEIKRELVIGELRDVRAAALPLIAALGGMVVPALIYTAFNAGGPGASGWGIPMATDIAFAVGVLALVGRRAPLALKVFLLTLAIADDIGAIVVIALFYAEGLAIGWLALAAAVVAAIVLLNRLGVRSLVPYAAGAAVLWFAIYESGIHATIAGVILGLLTPARPFHVPEAVVGPARQRLDEVATGPKAHDGVADEDEQTRLREVASLANEAVSPLTRMESKLHHWSSFVVLPLFALANAGVVLSGDAISGALSNTVALGVVTGLVIGKPVGIVLASFIAVRVRIARLPTGVRWLEIVGAGLLGGIGFTVAIFVAGLAFTDVALTDAAKVAILAGSVIAGILGFAALYARDATRSKA